MNHVEMAEIAATKAARLAEAGKVLLFNQSVLLLAFAALMLVAAIGILITSPGSDDDASDERRSVSPTGCRRPR